MVHVVFGTLTFHAAAGVFGVRNKSVREEVEPCVYHACRASLTVFVSVATTLRPASETGTHVRTSRACPGEKTLEDVFSRCLSQRLALPTD